MNMLGLTSRLPGADRGRLLMLTIAATIGLSALATSSAHASGCTDSWSAKGSGSWFVPGNWSTGKVPTSEDEVCITESAAASYTVEMAQTSTVTLKSLTVGGAEHTQTLVVASTNSLNAILTTSAGITNGTHGAITLTNAETSGNAVTVVGPISNVGTITTEPAHGGARSLQGNITNTGTLAINTNTNFNGSKAALTNEGAINLATGVALIVSNEGSATNAGNGKIAATGSGDVLMEPGTSFTEGAGTTSGAKPVVLRQANLAYTGSGASLITQHGESSTLSGNISSGQTLVLETVNTENVRTTAAGSFTNAGSITLTNAETAGNNVTLTIPTGTLTNSGTVTTKKAVGGARVLTGSITNTGTIAINTNTAFNGKGATLDNQGAINLATGVALTVSNEGSVTNGSSGKVAGTGSGEMLMEPGTTFTEGAGTTSGTKPVVLRQANLVYTGSGASLITQHGESSTLSGNISSGQTLVLETVNTENVRTTAAGSFTNAGSITLTNAETAGNNVTLTIPTGTLTNSGTVTTEKAVGGSRVLTGNITNTGTLAINTNTALNGEKAALTNDGALDIAAGIQLTVSNDGSVTNGSGGSIAAGAGADVFVEPGGTFTEGAGTTSGAKPVILRQANLVYTGSGASLITQHGESSTLSGNISAGQTLVLETINAENVRTTAAGSFTNAGSITLTNAETAGNNVTLTIPTGTLTNSGTITTETANGGSRQIQGNLINKSKLVFNSFLGYNGASATLKNEGAIEIAEAKQVTVSNGGSVVNAAGGEIIVGKGADLFMGSGTSFTEDAGTTSGGTPVVVDDGTLNYTGTGASQIALRGSDSLTGSIASGQSLLLESTCSENVVATAAASFANGGTITMTNGDSCGNNATLATSAGTLTNGGKIITEPGHGGARSLQGNLTNTGTLIFNTNTSGLSSGAMLLNEGTIDIATGVAFSIAGTATVTNGPGGLIAATGTGALVQTGGTFNQGLGAATGGEPIVLDDLTLNYTEHGSGSIALRGASTLGPGNIKVGEVLSIQSTCSEHAVVTAGASFTNNGTIELTNADGCANNATLNLKEATLTNTGTIEVDNPHGGVRAVDGDLTNSGIVMLAAGETLQVAGNYAQTALAKLKTVIAGASDFGALSVSGSVTLAGKLNLIQSPLFKGSLAQKFPIVSSTSLTGAFALESEGKLDSSGLYYEPTYAPTGVTLVVSQATLSLSPTSGLPGSSTTVSGSGYLPGDTIELKFSDHHEVKTLYPSVTVNSGGEFSTEVPIPASAALHGGEVKATSVQTGAKISSAFTVL
jgi:fibronectin-binding autotransporter adhesin